MLQLKFLGCLGNQIFLRCVRFNSRAGAPLSKELLLGVFTKKIGSLSKYDEDHDDDFRKTIGLMIKTTARAFEYISLTSTARLRRETS